MKKGFFDNLSFGRKSKSTSVEWDKNVIQRFKNLYEKVDQDECRQV